eukprot:527238-Prymnesium_polylepis.1
MRGTGRGAALGGRGAKPGRWRGRGRRARRRIRDGRGRRVRGGPGRGGSRRRRPVWVTPVVGATTTG